MKSALFSPFAMRGLTIDNRIMLSPLCQYSSIDGCMNDWQMTHLGMFAMSGASFVCFEMTDVEPVGRITYGCSGLYSDENEAALVRVLAHCRKYGQAKYALQIAHAGRRASKKAPFEGSKPISVKEGGWQAVAPSAIPESDGSDAPHALTIAEIKLLVEKFAAATQRAARIGFDAIELHGAHGYLLHQFLSPLSNQRTDEYGGSLVNRMRFPLEVFAAMRAVWPADKPLGVRISCTEWMPGGWDIDDAVVLSHELKNLGCDWIDASSGAGYKEAKIPYAPGYHMPFAERIKKEVNINTIAVGLITEFDHAEKVVANGQADIVALGRGMMWNPRWGWHAAKALGESLDIPRQYLRVRPGA